MAESLDIQLQLFEGQLVVVLSRLLSWTETIKHIYIMDIIFSEQETGEWTAAVYYRIRK